MIKYAGVVAATLLAVAPIAAPVLGTTTETKVEAASAPGYAVKDFIKNDDGTYTISGMVPATKDGQQISVSFDDVTMSPGEFSGKRYANAKLQTFDGYTVNHPTELMGLKLEWKTNKVLGFTTLDSPIIYTKDSSSDNSSSDDNNVTVPGTNWVTTFSPLIDAATYDDKGNLTAPVLSKTSIWGVDRQMDINGTTYYRVATNEWIKKSDGIEVFPNSTTVNTNKQASLYTSTGKAVTNRALAKNTPWYSDRSATINGVKMYRVATDEWVAASDVQ
ncbi:SLAP domain-containing protein [Companilactobacillus musae]|uniref:SLAP domain-containing protein n=1 Tax=Companilactobacillus musae TaxID=1903258 RepID=UPI000E64E8B6|nr:SLAP domain-containing protein [Companilactobacillus musae]